MCMNVHVCTCMYMYAHARASCARGMIGLRLLHPITPPTTTPPHTTYAFHCMDGSAMATHATANDDEVIVVFVGCCCIACEGGTPLHQNPERRHDTRVSIDKIIQNNAYFVHYASTHQRVPLGSSGQEIRCRVLGVELLSHPHSAQDIAVCGFDSAAGALNAFVGHRGTRQGRQQHWLNHAAGSSCSQDATGKRG